MKHFNEFLSAHYDIKREKPGLIYALIALGVAGRLLPHIPNVTPVGGMMVWSGVRLGRMWTISVLLAVMIVSDLFLGVHRTLPYVYGSLLVGAILASSIRVPTLLRIVAVTVINAILFFLITNFGVWFHSPYYPQTWSGLFASYSAAIPFLRASLVGDSAYVIIFFTLEYVALTRLAKRRMIPSGN